MHSGSTLNTKLLPLHTSATYIPCSECPWPLSNSVRRRFQERMAAFYQYSSIIVDVNAVNCPENHGPFLTTITLISPVNGQTHKNCLVEQCFTFGCTSYSSFNIPTPYPALWMIKSRPRDAPHANVLCTLAAHQKPCGSAPQSVDAF